MEMNKGNVLLMALVILLGSFLMGCSDKDTPEKENEEELIDRVLLLFSPVDGSAPIVSTALDPDGEGPEDIAPLSTITLKADTEYEVFISFENTVADEDITEEIEEEAAEHLIFFAFTEDFFSSPLGDGNFDNRTDPMNYLDEDENGLDLGLITGWVTGSAGNGTFRVVLKHQPEIKSGTSQASDGETDVDVTWSIEIL